MMFFVVCRKGFVVCCIVIKLKWFIVCRMLVGVEEVIEGMSV